MRARCPPPPTAPDHAPQEAGPVRHWRVTPRGAVWHGTPCREPRCRASCHSRGISTRCRRSSKMLILGRGPGIAPVVTGEACHRACPEL
jgi:hypothetical protein